MQITINNGGVAYGSTDVLTQVNFDLHDRDKVAIVGRNGCGKTSLLRVLTSEVELIQGIGEQNLGYYITGSPVIGYLKQNFTDLEISLVDEVRGAYTELLEVEKQLNETLEILQDDDSFELAKKYSHLQERYEQLGGYYYKKEYCVAIKQFGFSENEFEKPLSEFSGGQRTKIALIKLLLSKPDVLLLDEPTNHLDVNAIAWLENYLASYKKALIVVSHDRFFLDRIVNVVYEIEYGEMVRYTGNYSSFLEQKRVNYEKRLKDAHAKKAEIERLTKLVERFKAKANKAAMAQSKLKMIEKMGTVEMPNQYDMKTFKTSFKIEQKSSRETLVVQNLEFGYSEPLGKISFKLQQGKKLGILGANGCGKSTLLRTLISKLDKISGDIKFGHNVKLGYFDQTLSQSSSPDSVLDDFLLAFPSLNQTQARTALGAFLFTQEEVFKRVCDLSGGEKVRLALCKILKTNPNVLFLDEPTNHMDILSKEALENILCAYEGTLVIVSHDRFLINKVCDSLIVFEENKELKLLDYDYSQYLEKLKNVAEDESCEKEGSVKKESAIKCAPVNAEKLRKKALHRMSILEEKMAVFESELAELKISLENDPEIYSSSENYLKTQEKIDELNLLLEPLSNEWLSLSEQV